MKRLIIAFMMLCAACMASAANYLTFTAEEDSSTFGIVFTGYNAPDVQYSLDDGTTWIALTEGDTVQLAHKGDKALLKGDNPKYFSWLDPYLSFTMTGKVAASGSVMSLIDGVGLSTEIPNDYCFSYLFSGCTSLTQAPELPATTLAEGCYNGMFKDCTSLTQAPVLPATKLSDACYGEMFSGCTSLTQAPALPATTLSKRCYPYMFRDCISLTQAPALPAVKLSDACYFGMFSGCASLTQAPELPATTLDYYCYRFMFEGCTSLTQVPELPATKMSLGCYAGMFLGCTGLTHVQLPNATLFYTCYDGMFAGCANLSEISVLFDDWNGGASTYDWVKDVAPTGTFICPKTLPFGYGTSRIPNGWKVKNIIDGDTVEVPITYNFLTFTAEEDSVKLGIMKVNNANEDREDGNPDVDYTYGDVSEDYRPDVQYSLDGGKTWAPLVDVITLAHKGDSALLRGDNPGGLSTYLETYSYFGMRGKIAASGSVMSLLDGAGENSVMPKDSRYCFARLFFKCTSLTQAPELPATTLAENCYTEMFSGCTGLTQAPELPATTLARNCYQSMFSGCTGLTQAPELPATTLNSFCYEGMFSGCTSLAQAPALPADTADYHCYAGMFKGCTSLTQAPELPATTLDESCYGAMFSGCTGLTQAPELPATTLAEGCYANMFAGCIGLTQAPELPATTLAPYCYRNMFSGCTGLTRAPELPVKMLEEDSYETMFSDCTNLSEIHVSFEDWNDGANTTKWVNNVAPTGTFICPEALALEFGKSKIPTGWVVKNIVDGDTVDVPVGYSYLTFTAEEDGSTFSFVNKDNNPDVQYSLDGGVTWIALAEGDTVVLAHKGDKALLRGDNPQGFSKGSYRYSTFRMTGKVAASGSVMSLVDGAGLSTEIPVDYCFYGLFNDCTSLTQAPELPATRLESSCYNRMFSGCTSLTQAPALPATIAKSDCYSRMFYGCTSLTQAPELPATTLARNCYESMFSGCTSLTQASALPAMRLSLGCYESMFSGCTSLTQAPALPATILATDCYKYMFTGCTSLTASPELPATSLDDGCYYGMFSGCTNLSQIAVMFTYWFDADDPTYEWVKDVAPTGTFFCLGGMYPEYGVSWIPEGWTMKPIEAGYGVSSTLADGITVWTDDLTVYVRGAEGEVFLYDMSGRSVAVSNTADEERALSVPAKGAYVVRTSGGERSVLVR